MLTVQVGAVHAPEALQVLFSWVSGQRFPGSVPATANSHAPPAEQLPLRQVPVVHTPPGSTPETSVWHWLFEHCLHCPLHDVTMVPVPAALQVVNIAIAQVVEFGGQVLHRGPVVVSAALQPGTPQGVASSALPSALQV